ncbi:MAG: efflux RND transporter periplasmic adaptor subunit [Pseudomonadales bacterium]|nr:efflux RND transporter periplasmic adaptor subunit [Pseudomonadales bacterium]
MRKNIGAGVVLVLVICLSSAIIWRFMQDSGPPRNRGAQTAAIPVELADIHIGSIAQRREFTGTLEAEGQLIVAPKISGRVERLHVNLADPVTRGQVVVELDNAEYLQAVAQAEAEMAVAKANLLQAKSLLEIAERELSRVSALRKRGLSSESAYDAAVIAQLTRKTQLEVSSAELQRAESLLNLSQIRLGYTRINAIWQGGDGQRIVGERFVEEGDTVSANTPLLRIIELNPIRAVFYVTERDYGQLKSGQQASVSTDVFPGLQFLGEIVRIAPVFRENTRQARVELKIANVDGRLKPGMFVRATVELTRVQDAILVPEQALSQRDSAFGIFIVDEGQTARWIPVQPGIQNAGQVQIQLTAEADQQVMERLLATQVVTLGQQLLDDGMAVQIPAKQISATQAIPPSREHVQ